MFAIGTVTFCDKRIQNTQGDKKGNPSWKGKTNHKTIDKMKLML